LKYREQASVPRRPRTVQLLLNAAICLVFLATCGGAQVSAGGGPGRAGDERAQRFDALTMTLELDETSVRTGGEIESRLLIENRSGKTVTDPGCLIAAGRYSLIPMDEPDAELWLAPVVDCQGPFTMPDGFEESYSGPTFPAATKFGDPLPPGRYIASLHIEELSDRFQQPVVITE
jgi:hypothetical protein